ncbi:MAG: cyclic nucleotide-binding domain-containing protein [Melioribacteraceae bacterium]|jgi:CRP-like cAMP-binding protein|nr:cyclic nucleotide-binding domain-containing protein [Melioribacteraceae bacterium]RJP56885.1 MAG: cyclic nucleotide-binding domain-containing protein [Ignavibacteriales bacterium]WKZ68204.1 MAG: cyclic nucleotide-binding domain-containing protein [Melioribacteraceae bacterium]
MDTTQELIKSKSSFWANLFKTPGEKSDLEELLLAMPPFENLRGKYIKLLMQIIHNRVYEANEYIFYQGDPGIGLYIVREGSVVIKQSIDDKEPIDMATLTRGDFFGELALLDDEVRSGSAVALEACSIAVIFKPDLDEFIERYPKAGLKILKGISTIISTRLRRVNDEYFSLYVEKLK